MASKIEYKGHIIYCSSQHDGVYAGAIYLCDGTRNHYVRSTTSTISEERVIQFAKNWIDSYLAVQINENNLLPLIEWLIP